jgi:hypothetical protein
LLTANLPILDKSLRNRLIHLPDDFAVLLPKRSGIAPSVYDLLAGLHKQKYILWAGDGASRNYRPGSKTSCGISRDVQGKGGAPPGGVGGSSRYEDYLEAMANH